MTKDSFRPATTAESRSLKNQASIQQLKKRFDALAKFSKQVQITCDRFAKLFTQHGGKS